MTHESADRSDRPVTRPVTRPGWTAEAGAVLALHSQVNPVWCRACGGITDYAAHVAAALADAGLGDARTDGADLMPRHLAAYVSCDHCGAERPPNQAGMIVTCADCSTHDEADAGLAAKVAALTSALERTEANFIASVNGRPVRDMAENLAENRAALADPEGAGR